MIRDTVNSLRLTISERVGNPFISAALIASAVVNWRLSLLLISDVPYDGKINKIIELYPTSQVQFDSFLLYPIYFAAFWTFVWPAVGILINTYWYWMKSNMSNSKLWAERKKMLSESEAAELYTTIDAQDSKYLELLKDRQSRIDSLTQQIRHMAEERDRSLTELNSVCERKKLELGEAQHQLYERKNEAEKLKLQVADQSRRLDEILNHSLKFSGYLPGLKAITNAINKSTNHHASEFWIKEEFGRQETSLKVDERQRAFDFYMALGLLRKESDGQIGFSDQYKYEKDKVLGMYNNSPGIKNKSLSHGVRVRSGEQ